MPIENDFLPFAVGSSANVEAQTTWVSDPVLQTGFQSGVANSAQANKVLRQASIIASMIAQFIVDNSGQPAIDDGTTATLEANLKASVNTLITSFVANALGAGGTIYSPQFASVSADAIDDSGAGGQFRLVYGNYGVILRNDGGTVWILLTNSGNASGTFNSLRPFSINLATGAVTIDATGVGTYFGGNVSAPSASISGNETVSGQVTAGSINSNGTVSIRAANTPYQIYAAGNPGDEKYGEMYLDGGGNLTIRFVNDAYTLANTILYASRSGVAITGITLGAQTTINGAGFASTPATGNRSTQIATTQCFANEFANSIGGLNGYQKLPSGLIIEWGSFGPSEFSGSATLVTLPVAFPHGPLSICATDVGLGGASNVHITAASFVSNSQFYAYANNPATNSPATTNLGWIAIGY